MKKTLFAIAAGMIAMSASAASALPSAKPGLHGKPTAQTVEYKKKWKGHRDVRHREDHRYDKYRGWHRYSHRPRDWRVRNCIAVGPIWFCP